MLTVAIPKRNKLQNIIVLTPKDGSCPCRLWYCFSSYFWIFTFFMFFYIFFKKSVDEMIFMSYNNTCRWGIAKW